MLPVSPTRTVPHSPVNTAIQSSCFTERRYPIPVPDHAPDCLKTLTSRVIRKKTIPTSPEALLEKCWKNTKKAFNEHKEQWTSEVSAEEVYALSVSPECSAVTGSEPLQLTYASVEDIGTRPFMEDAHLFDNTRAPEILAGVFDGHGGSDIAKFAAENFSQTFFTQLKRCGGHVPLALELALEVLQEEILSKTNQKMLSFAGTTALLCYIDCERRTVYTATLGDSEANIYRKIDGKMRSISLSCCRNWTSEKDFARLKPWTEKYQLPYKYPTDLSPKNTRIFRKDHSFGGVNLSRALGDLLYGEVDKGIRMGISQKPKVTLLPLHRGDILILTCDGLKDYVPEQDILSEVAKLSHSDPWTLGKALLQKALWNMHQPYGDNVTVLTLFVS